MAQAALSEPVRLRSSLVTQVRELGTHIQFSRHCTLGTLPDRFQEANTRLHRLYHSPASLQQKALVVQNSVWPFAMYGSYSLAPGAQRFYTLRGNAARAIHGRHHTMALQAALYFAPSVVDPEAYHMIQQARQLHRCFCVMLEIASRILELATLPEVPPTAFGRGLPFPSCLPATTGSSCRKAASRGLATTTLMFGGLVPERSLLLSHRHGSWRCRSPACTGTASQLSECQQGRPPRPSFVRCPSGSSLWWLGT